ncbi:MAG: hypothetical protein ACI9SI_000457 [Polaribacter sp.]|jgi:hypothetical protein
MEKEIKRKANKLILVGNGFDLALGLKTTYNDFILWFLKDEVKIAVNSGNITIENFKTINGYTKNDLFELFLDAKYTIVDYDKIFEEQKDVLKFLDIIKKYKFRLKSSSDLFNAIIKDAEFNWVDIESIYFELLKSILNVKNRNLEKIDKLNSDLVFLIKKLIEYLKTINTEISNKDASLFLNHFKNYVTNDELLIKESFDDFGATYFLNFNYTDSITKLIKQLPSHLQLEENNIHGTLENSESIIFGFGDEMDKIYNDIEELNDNRFFEHIKSFKYFKSKNYRELLRFLDNEYFQVCIYGHSCGLSDRVMLNEIFEHENCKSIKIYYHENDEGKNDFVEKTMEISRHFKNNKDMRRKILDFNEQCKIPQIKL